MSFKKKTCLLTLATKKKKHLTENVSTAIYCLKHILLSTAKNAMLKDPKDCVHPDSIIVFLLKSPVRPSAVSPPTAEHRLHL